MTLRFFSDHLPLARAGYVELVADFTRECQGFFGRVGTPFLVLFYSFVKHYMFDLLCFFEGFVRLH